jgi:hypothetical protein
VASVVCDLGTVVIASRSRHYKELAQDPPRPEYERIWVPRKIVSGAWSPNIPAGEAYTEDILAIWAIVRARVPVTVALTGLTVSIERAAGARTAGAAEHEARQLVQASCMPVRPQRRCLMAPRSSETPSGN